MASSNQSGPSHQIQRLRHRFAFNLGVTQSRKMALYEDLLNSVSLFDISYWLQVLFSAGIATLGLVLNSPAVIIGAMLISPLMGPILANGMAFAVGDLVLAARAILCLNLSCIVAVGFAMLLIAVLPFKEQTPEIAARIEPNLLDLSVALFSGALGAVATTKKPEGVVTSIPGVAIAVALMPPLCVVGFGIGRALSVQLGEGLRIAWGGGLLFVTNLTAITLMAMLMFMLIRINVPSIKRRAEEWHNDDPESRWMRRVFDGLPGATHLEVVGSWQNRLLVWLIPLLVLLIPLGQSFGQLQAEFHSQQRRNEVESIVEKIWLDDFANDRNNKARAYVDTLDFLETTDNLLLQIRVFTSEIFTEDEKSKFVQRLADKLDRDRETIELRLVQIPTSQGELKGAIESGETLEVAPVLSVPELQSELWNQIDASLGALAFPDEFQLLNYGVRLEKDQFLAVNVGYLGDRTITEDAQDILTKEVRRRLGNDQTQVTFNHVRTKVGELLFEEGAVTLTPSAMKQLDLVAFQMNRYPELQLQVQSKVLENEGQSRDEGDVVPVFPLVELRNKAIQNYLKSFAKIDAERVQTVELLDVVQTGRPAAVLTFKGTLERSPEKTDATPSLPDSQFIHQGS